VVDTTNTPQESRWYDPFGTEIQQSGTQQTTFGFTGEETDSNGLVNLRARNYSPYISQFLTIDTFEGSPAQPLSLNRYSYVQGNPANATDPGGHDSCDEVASIAHYANIFTPGNPPTYEQMTGCANSLIANNSYLNEHKFDKFPLIKDITDVNLLVMDYNEAIEAILRYKPSIFGEDLFTGLMLERFKNDFSDSVNPPLQPTIFPNVSGYIEGISASVAAGVGLSAGLEIVYDFATFQSAQFQYGSIVKSLSDLLKLVHNPSIGLSASASVYVGYVNGFTGTTSGESCDPYYQFNNQYGGPFDVLSLGIADGLGFGGTYFQSPSDPHVNGFTFNLAAGAGLDVSRSQPYYSRTYAYQQTYIDRVTGKVDTTRLTTYINNGSGLLGPVLSFDPFGGILNQIRGQVASAAFDKAVAYNNNVQPPKPCGCYF